MQGSEAFAGALYDPALRAVTLVLTPSSAEAALGGLSSFCSEPGGWQRGAEPAELQPLQRDLPAGLCLSDCRALLSQVQHRLRGAAGAARAASSGGRGSVRVGTGPWASGAPAAPAVPGEGSSKLWLTGSGARGAWCCHQGAAGLIILLLQHQLL